MPLVRQYRLTHFLIGGRPRYIAFHEPARDIAASIHQAGALTVYEVRDDLLFSRELLESTRRNAGAPQWTSIGEPLFVPSKNGFRVTNQNHVRQQVDVILETVIDWSR